MIPLFAVHMPHSVDKPLLETLHSGYIGQGPRTEEFEEKLRGFFQFNNVLTLNSGTSGLQLALRLAGVGKVNDISSYIGTHEVITTPMTCTATNMPILAAGAVPVWADVNPDTGLIDPLDVERKISPNTKAILCVHWGGTPCDLKSLNEIAQYYDIPLIEDCAHALGSNYNGVRLGHNTADYSVFSLQAIKHITTVDGGILAVRSGTDYRRGKLIRWYGIDRETDRKDFRCEEDIEEWGLKWHMNDVAAVIGIHQLDYIDSVLSAHKRNAKHFWEVIDRTRFQPAFSENTLNQSAFWLFTILLSNSQDRIWFMEHMKDWGIMTSQVHARNDTHTTFAPYQKRLPGVDKFTERMVCIPVHWKLTEKEVDRITSAINAYKVKESVGI